MKLTIERLDALTDQDKIDLAKIWPNQQVSDWQSEGDLKIIFAARFNDRLLGAVKVSISGKQAELNDLCVREVTRRRGVGLYLLEDLQQQLPEVRDFSMQAVADKPALDAFMRACGFELIADGWHKTRH
ncbi:aspartate 1-decarboxylase autocleavage activator PanM [Serratia sp. M24T3]|uniref:aspartate 1-decarboxylase autocleavage activator PanM n=1 Tax=Serratia sp. M24T3 TaxID=932213 RepID=UPI00025BA7C7|nr:aspartate 1-decarboxylase autocleavage activator PanM [Serratia sp. M24T3]EIC82627.1 acetyltransferase [Serratia sp. M24T3]